MIQSTIERYVAGAIIPARLIEGLSRADLLARPVPATWSIQEIICHLLDSDLTGADRMKRVIAEDSPRYQPYDQEAFAMRLGYDHLNLESVVELFRLNREITGILLRQQPREAFRRVGYHAVDGEETLERLVIKYTEHVHWHSRFVLEKRMLLNRPLEQDLAS